MQIIHKFVIFPIDLRIDIIIFHISFILNSIEFKQMRRIKVLINNDINGVEKIEYSILHCFIYVCVYV